MKNESELHEAPVPYCSATEFEHIRTHKSYLSLPQDLFWALCRTPLPINAKLAYLHLLMFHNFQAAQSGNATKANKPITTTRAYLSKSLGLKNSYNATQALEDQGFIIILPQEGRSPAILNILLRFPEHLAASLMKDSSERPSANAAASICTNDTFTRLCRKPTFQVPLALFQALAKTDRLKPHAKLLWLYLSSKAKGKHQTLVTLLLRELAQGLSLSKETVSCHLKTLNTVGFIHSNLTASDHQAYCNLIYLRCPRALLPDVLAQADRKSTKLASPLYADTVTTPCPVSLSEKNLRPEDIEKPAVTFESHPVSLVKLGGNFEDINNIHNNTSKINSNRQRLQELSSFEKVIYLQELLSSFDSKLFETKKLPEELMALPVWEREVVQTFTRWLQANYPSLPLGQALQLWLKYYQFSDSVKLDNQQAGRCGLAAGNHLTKILRLQFGDEADMLLAWDQALRQALALSDPALVQERKAKALAISDTPIQELNLLEQKMVTQTLTQAHNLGKIPETLSAPELANIISQAIFWAPRWQCRALNQAADRDKLACTLKYFISWIKKGTWQVPHGWQNWSKAYVTQQAA